MSALSSITPVTAPVPTSIAEALAPTPAKRRGGPKFTRPSRGVCRTKDSRAVKRLISQFEVLRRRDLTAEERGACVCLCTPLTRD